MVDTCCYYVLLIPSVQRTKKQFYVGYTSYLRKKFESHNVRQNISTKYGAPWEMVYYEAYPTKEDAKRREYKLKRYGQALRQIKARVTIVNQP